jgi:hypothetical protein
VSGSAQASHAVDIQNRSLLRFEVSIAAHCGSDRLYYPGNVPIWEANVQVNKRPAGGGASKRRVSRPLSCSEESSDEAITVVVKYEALGCRCTGSAEMQLLVDTRP